MEPRILIVFVLRLTLSATQNINTNKIEDDPNPFAEAADAFMKDGGAQLGDMVSNLMQSKEGQQLGGMLMDAALNSGGAAQLLSGLGSMIGNKDGGGLDPALLSNVMGMLGNTEKSGNSEDMGNFLNMAGSLLQNSGINAQNTMEYLPQILDTINSFTGEEAKQRELEHSSHAWLMPPVLEKLHLLFDHFAHSELGRGMWRKLGLEKLFETFSQNGRFNFGKFFELLENQSFRRHWINLVTVKITDFVAFITHPKTHKL